DKIVPLDKVIEMLQAAGARYKTNVDGKKVLLSNGATDIILTRTTCEHAKLQNNPSQACNEYLDLFVTPSGTINKCIVANNEQESILPEVKSRDDFAVVAKLKSINEKLGVGCVYNSHKQIQANNRRGVSLSFGG
ncbi:MAG: hypothetical protein LBH47_02115, partial [Christensenellaceae bacterium]|nr:hypothetical protein [Christensenellaceae bacterium]